LVAESLHKSTTAIDFTFAKPLARVCLVPNSEKRVQRTCAYVGVLWCAIYCDIGVFELSGPNSEPVTLVQLPEICCRYFLCILCSTGTDISFLQFYFDFGTDLGGSGTEAVDVVVTGVCPCSSVVYRKIRFLCWISKSTIRGGRATLWVPTW